MSATPEDFMQDPAKRRDQPPAHEDAGSSLWQWLAIGVLVGCWLAEATWCIDRGF